jgi:hypothetical protein
MFTSRKNLPLKILRTLMSDITSKFPTVTRSVSAAVQTTVPTHCVRMFYVFCTLHGNIILQYNPAKCTSSKLIFSFLWCLLHVSNPRIHLQEDGCTYRYGTVCFTCIGVRTLPPTKVPVPLHVNTLYQTCTHNRLPEDEPSGSKHVEDTTKIKILVYKCAFCWVVLFIVLCCLYMFMVYHSITQHACCRSHLLSTLICGAK